MTIVVAGADERAIWMAADALVSGGTLGLREREYALKIETGPCSLVAFAGDVELGRSSAAIAAAAVDQDAALATLRSASAEGGVEFALGWWDQGPVLHYVTNGRSTRTAALHLGSHEAFEQLQAIRHNPELAVAPNALKTLVSGSRGPYVPPALSAIIRPMMDLFASRLERDIGGWVLPYSLDEAGAHLCEYAYSTSDPVLGTALGRGEVVPHGTAALGGFHVSVTELRKQKGVVVYWLQLPGGVVLFPPGPGNETQRFLGNPTEFKAATAAEFGEPATLLVSGIDRTGLPDSLNIMLDEHGTPAVAVAGYGDDFTLAVLNVEAPFFAAGRLPKLGGADLPPIPGIDLGITVEGDRASLALTGPDTVMLAAAELEQLQAALAQVRARLSDQVSSEPPVATALIGQFDPAWRTISSVHQAAPGVVLHLRHSGYGWMTFILPPNEAAALGRWLVEHSQ